MFASALTRDADGQHWLVPPAEKGPIEVEDAPFLAVEAFIAGAGEQQLISVRSNVDEIATIDDEHPLHIETDPKTGELKPYVLLNKGLKAKLSRALYYDLVAVGVKAESGGRGCLGVWSSGRLFLIGWLDEAP